MPHSELAIPVVWSDVVLAHEPAAEIWVGVRTPGTERPERATTIRDAVVAAGAHLVPAARHDDTELAQVHDPAMLRWLAQAWDLWVAGGFPVEPGQDRVVPYVFPTDGLLGGLPLREPAATHARAGRYCYDTMTLVGPGTWAAARAAADAARTAAGLVADGVPLAYALCRPPGHHAARSAFGGSCYLNNAAVAVAALQGRGLERVAVVDLDAHHGNGTQSLFYDRGDVLYASVHVDPGAGWFPHFVGFADETGAGDGTAANVNVPLPPGTGDAGWLDGVDRLLLAVDRFAPHAVVVSLGVDAARDDPESPLDVTADGYRAAGRRLAAVAPTVVVQEGGYHLPTLGPLVVAALTGMSGA